jgi:hypothetical protein
MLGCAPLSARREREREGGESERTAGKDVVEREIRR